MNRKIMIAGLALMLCSFSGVARAQNDSKQSDKVKVNAKDLADMKRQVRMMRAEMAELEEKMDQITGMHDAVYNTEKASDDKKDSSSQ